MEKPISADDIVMPALLRAARAAYTNAVRKAAVAAGFEDMPKNGAYVIGAIGRGAAMANIIQGLGISKQAAGQLIDALVLRGYVECREDPEDRRKLSMALTTSGEEAAATIRKATNGVDARLKKRAGAKSVSEARKVLLTLIAIANEGQSP